MKRAIVWLVVLLALGAAGYFGYRWYEGRGSSEVQFRTAQVRRMDIAQTISATGTVVPEDVIDVGAQVNGQIAEFGKDKAGKPVDYRSEVEEGMLLAKIDDALYQADLASAKAQQAQAQAQVQQAQAQVQVNQANLEQANARLNQATRDWERAQRLANTAALSKADYDASQSAFEQGRAAVVVAKAAIEQAKASETQARAQVAQTDATILRAQRNVNYTVIKSPVSGTIIDRRVEIGQTVVSSLNAPSLFLIARDLSKMQVLVQVNEADIGHVHPGQAVAFTVEAFPGIMFKGEVRKVRLNATMTQNVVTYTVEISTDNTDLKLLPYLTANVKFDVAHRNNVLGVPNAALRYTPPGATPPATPESSGRRGETPGVLWTLRDGKPVSVPVKAGLSDGVSTEVSGEGLSEGMDVIIGEAQTQQQAGATSVNPFAPQMGRGGRSSTGGQRPAGAGAGGGAPGSGPGGAAGGAGAGGGARPGGAGGGAGGGR